MAAERADEDRMPDEEEAEEFINPDDVFVEVEEGDEPMDEDEVEEISAEEGDENDSNEVKVLSRAWPTRSLPKAADST